MPFDALIVGLIVLLICGAAFFYLYMRISFYERKGNMMEAVIVDLKVAIDSLMSSGHPYGGAPIPISPSVTPEAAAQLSAPLPLESSESENIPEEGFYSSVLDQAHSETVKTEDAPLEAVQEVSSEEDLDSLTKNDLVTLAEKRGLRAKKSANRNELLSLLRRTNPTQNSTMTAGADNAAGSTAAALDGSVVDVGQGGASLE